MSHFGSHTVCGKGGPTETARERERHKERSYLKVLVKFLMPLTRKPPCYWKLCNHVTVASESKEEHMTRMRHHILLELLLPSGCAGISLLHCVP